jgi:hypothetical protein
VTKYYGSQNPEESGLNVQVAKNAHILIALYTTGTQKKARVCDLCAEI